MKDFLLKNLNKYSVFFIIFLLSAAIFSLLAYENYLARASRELYLNPYNGASIISDYPVLNNESFDEITASAAAVLDKSSGRIIFERNGNILFPPASTTKIMTALVSVSYFKPEDILIIKSSEPDGVVIGFEKGDKISFENLLYAMMLPSANDAALAIADNFPGGEEAFIETMNEKAKELRLLNTSFGDSIGLSSSSFTTAQDLARLASYALNNPEIKKVASTKSRRIVNSDGSKSYSLSNLNKLLGVNGVNGVKTGYTEEAGQVLVVSKEEIVGNKERTTIVVVMKSEDRFSDMRKLLGGLSGNITYLSIHP